MCIPITFSIRFFFIAFALLPTKKTFIFNYNTFQRVCIYRQIYQGYVISYNSLVFSIDLKLLAISTFKRFECQSSQLEPELTALFAGPSWGRRGGQAAPDQPLPGAHRHGGHACQKVGTRNNDIQSKFHEIEHSKVDR